VYSKKLYRSVVGRSVGSSSPVSNLIKPSTAAEAASFDRAAHHKDRALAFNSTLFLSLLLKHQQEEKEEEKEKREEIRRRPTITQHSREVKRYVYM
jgi:hypothetical protein